MNKENIPEEAICPDCNRSGKGKNKFSRCHWCAGIKTIYIMKIEEEE